MVVLLTLLSMMQLPPLPVSSAVAESTFSARDWQPAAILTGKWKMAPVTEIVNDFYGKSVSLSPTDIRFRWTRKNLYILFVCPWRELNLKPSPVTNAETNKLWDWDVAELFIGTDSQHIGRYKEFEVSPQGEYVDLDIDRDDPKNQQGLAWNSGFSVAARVDPSKKPGIKKWYGEMRIPFASLGVSAPKSGDEFRIGLFRIEGPEPNRIYVSWQPTGAKSFHVPKAFGRLILK